MFQKSAPCGRVHLCRSELTIIAVCVCVGLCIHVWASCVCVRGCWCLCHTLSLYVNVCRCHHGYGSSMITAVTGNFRPSRVLPRPGCHDNAVNRTKAAGNRTVSPCFRFNTFKHTRTFTVLCKNCRIFMFTLFFCNAPVLLTCSVASWKRG